jgi:2-oxoglutarate dehydrogenase E2 component (dihydrolipoamide succinyltransferase)
MAIEIKAPVFPESVADGTVATWHKKPGEAVSRDELIVDIETDKVVLEVVAPADGVISQVLKNEGDTVLSQEVLAFFEAGAAAAAPAAVTPVAATPVTEATVVDDALSPAVRKLIAEHNLDPAKIIGTGKGGRLTKEDVDNHPEETCGSCGGSSCCCACTCRSGNCHGSGRSRRETRAHDASTCQGG